MITGSREIRYPAPTNGVDTSKYFSHFFQSASVSIGVFKKSVMTCNFTLPFSIKITPPKAKQNKSNQHNTLLLEISILVDSPTVSLPKYFVNACLMDITKFNGPFRVSHTIFKTYKGLNDQIQAAHCSATETFFTLAIMIQFEIPTYLYVFSIHTNVYLYSSTYLNMVRYQSKIQRTFFEFKNSMS